MANLLGQDIGLNYKGLINIGSTINQNISASLQSLTDGDGNLLPLQISTTQISIGGATGTGRLIVRGDGTNPIFRAENNSGVERFSIPNAGAITTNSDISIPANNLFVSGSASFSGTGSAAALYWSGSGSNGRVGVNSGGVFIDYGGTTKTNTSGTLSLATLTSAFGAAAGSANFRPLSINYTINNSGAQTGTMTGIFLNATETALNGMTHNLMDLQVGGTSAFRVQNVINGIGITTSGSWIAYNNSSTRLVGIQTDIFYIFTTSSRFQVSLGTGEARILGNTFVGSTAVTPTARLHVRGDGTNPIARFEGSAGTGTFVIDSAGNTITHSAAGTQGSFTLQASHRQTLFITATAYTNFGIGVAPLTNSGLNITNGALTVTYLTYANMNGADFYNQRNLMSFVQSSGSVNFESIGLFNTINQTGTANGITRGLYILPTLTSAVDFRAIEVRAGSTSAHDLILLTNAAGNKVFEVNAAQQIGLFGVTPIAQPTTAITGATVTSGSGAPILEDDTFAGFTVAQVVQALVNLGILKP